MKTQPDKIWTAEDEAKLEKLWNCKTFKELSQIFGTSEHAVYCRATIWMRLHKKSLRKSPLKKTPKGEY